MPRKCWRTTLSSKGLEDKQTKFTGGSMGKKSTGHRDSVIPTTTASHPNHHATLGWHFFAQPGGVVSTDQRCN